ncbi:hypothetical protein MKEN_01028400 [Mycena kentingensis (nom. inval.)]|nr:hypothetical protein MKEN_01028400 [Mycena kentingensis (nom. inval.)]
MRAAAAGTETIVEPQTCQPHPQPLGPAHILLQRPSMLVLTRFATLITAALFYVYTKLRTAFRARTNAARSNSRVKGDVEQAYGDVQDPSSVSASKQRVHSDPYKSEDNLAPCTDASDGPKLPSPHTVLAPVHHHRPLRPTIEPKLLRKPTAPTRPPLGSITNIQTRPARSRSIKRMPASPNLRFEAHLGAGEAAFPIPLPLSTDAPPPTTEGPASAAWFGEKEKLLLEAKRWSASVQQRKRASLPIMGKRAVTTEARRISAPAVLASAPTATERKPLAERLQRAVSVPAAPYDDAPSPTRSPSAPETDPEQDVGIYGGLGIPFIVGEDSLGTEDIVDDLTLIAVTEADMSTETLEAPAIPVEDKYAGGIISLYALSDSECGSASELAYLQASDSEYASSSESASPLSLSLALPFVLPDPAPERRSDGTLGDVLDALEEMLESPKWLKLVDLEGAAGRREQEVLDGI